LKSRKRQPLG
jgi:hypothetical protein